jgi:hypothetical protein
MVAAWFVAACSPSDAAHCKAGGIPLSGIVETGSLGGDTGGNTLFVPEGIEVTARPGLNSVFNVFALTLQPGPNGAELYAAVRNDGDVLACNASFSVELRDKDDQVLGAGVSGLMSRHFYRLSDGSGTIAGCVAPGEVTKVAIQSLSLDAPIGDVQRAVYQSNYWANLGVVAIEGVSLTGVETVTRSTAVAYTGALFNGLDTTLSDPTVAVYPVNAVGRPLGVAYAGSSLVLQPCGSWDFETSAVNQTGVGYDAYPMGGP